MDDRIRCFGSGDEAYARYHDEEWGRDVEDSPDERELFERLCLEGFQAGLSWLTVLRKREAFRAAFAGFAPAEVAEFDDDDVERLMSDPGIIHNRMKIRATIGNARALLALHTDGGRLRDLVEAHRPERHRRPLTFADLAGSTPESEALSKELKKLGFRFVGPTTVYALMQALNIVDDHLAGCWVAQEREGVR
ncbi:DNA-3-methyladenine glycosylase I [Tessaracoccus caeni]|uniref:DNA-3-methyladenine glycosylase I n=1 Tax=Tessaracoccus caeni TaxID=3031239 RepID=UPI0023DC23BE|nr:DNA-3-methyladenine glycosylase I [Tessaracoccus caeni]MDF1489917.1 DNA-3-methyladenine glycosylase I [Tessaracoccus caeni]